MEDSKLAQGNNDDADEVGREAVAATLAGKGEIVSGSLTNKLLETGAKVLPDKLIGAAHERFVESDRGE